MSINVALKDFSSVRIVSRLFKTAGNSLVCLAKTPEHNRLSHRSI